MCVLFAICEYHCQACGGINSYFCLLFTNPCLSSFPICCEVVLQQERQQLPAVRVCHRKCSDKKELIVLPISSLVLLVKSVTLLFYTLFAADDMEKVLEKVK